MLRCQSQVAQRPIIRMARMAVVAVVLVGGLLVFMVVGFNYLPPRSELSNWRSSFCFFGGFAEGVDEADVVDA